MPEMDGFEFLKNLKIQYTNTDFDHYAFLFSRSQRDRKGLKQCLCKTLLSKPLQVEEFTLLLPE
jgi:CheY-like chemotaxis protein